jgi:hypothetical protein
LTAAAPAGASGCVWDTRKRFGAASVAASPGMVGGGGSLLAPMSDTSGAIVRRLRNRSARPPPDFPLPGHGRRAPKCTKPLCGRVQYAPGGFGEELSQ